MLPIQIETWSLFKKMWCIFASCLSIALLLYFLEVSDCYNQFKTTQIELGKFKFFFLIKKASKKIMLRRNESKLEAVQIHNLHRAVNLPVLFLYLIGSCNKSALQLVSIKPVQHDRSIQVQMILFSGYFQLLHWVTQLNRAPWLFRIVKLTIISSNKRLQIQLLLEVCH